MDHRLLPGPVDPVHQTRDIQNVAAQQEHRRSVVGQGQVQGLRLFHRRDHRRPLQKRQHGMGHIARPLSAIFSPYVTTAGGQISTIFS